VGAAGRTDLTGASLDRLLESIQKKILPLPKETVVWPGHDYGETPSSTLEREQGRISILRISWSDVIINDFHLHTANYRAMTDACLNLLQNHSK